MSAAEVGYTTEYVDDGDRALQIIEPGQVPAVSNPYVGMSAIRFTEAQAAILARPVTPTEVQLRPDGIAYFPEIYYRRRLNESFGPGAWALQIVRFAENGETIVAHCRLYVEGRFVAEALGEASYSPNNHSYTYATAAESAKSNGLMRCCKDLGIASELWDPNFLKDWLAVNAIQVWCTNIGSGQGAGKKKKLWRLKKDPPIDAFPWREGDGDGKGRQSQPRQEQPKSSQEPPQSSPEPPREEAKRQVLSPDQEARTNKLIDTVKARKMPIGEAMKILNSFGFEKTSKVTAEKFNEVLSALCNWEPPKAEPEPIVDTMMDDNGPAYDRSTDLYAEPEAAPEPQPEAKPVQRMTEKESLAEKRKEILQLGQKLIDAGVPVHEVESLIESKTGVRAAQHVTDSFDANTCLVAMETRLEQAQKSQKQAAKRKG